MCVEAVLKGLPSLKTVKMVESCVNPENNSIYDFLRKARAAPALNDQPRTFIATHGEM